MLGHSIIALCCAAFLFVGIYIQGIWKELPSIENPNALLARQSLVIQDRNGNELYRFYDEEDRRLLHSDIFWSLFYSGSP